MDASWTLNLVDTLSPWLQYCQGNIPMVLLVAVPLLVVAWGVLRRYTMLDLCTIPTPPLRIPVLGHLIQMALHVSNGHEQFLKWHEAYGSILRIRLLHRDVVLVADPIAAAQVLAKGPNEVYKRTPEYAAFDAAHGMRGLRAIMTERDEDRWRAVRRTIAPAYGPAAIRSAFPSIIKCYAQACSGIATGAALRAPPSTTTATAATKRTDNNHNNSKSSSSTSPSSAAVCIDEEIFSATIRVMAEGFLEMDLQRLQQEVDCQRVAADVAGLVAITNSFVSQPWKKWLYLGLPNLCQESRTFHRQRNHLMSLTDKLAQHVEGGRSLHGPQDSSLVACLGRLREPSTGQLFSHQALQAELFLETVGQEAIPWTAAWTLFLLTQHTEAEAAMLQELREAGLACDGDVEAAAAALTLDLVTKSDQLPYCTAVLKEAMRMFPAGVAATPRMTHQATQVGPYKVPAGVIVFPCLYSILMYSGNWEQAHQFRPERWLREQQGQGPNKPRVVDGQQGSSTVHVYVPSISGSDAGSDGSDGGSGSSSSSSPRGSGDGSTCGSNPAGGSGNAAGGGNTAAFIPFGVGPKACIAQQLAYVQLKVLLALLVSCFSWELAPCMGGPQGVMSQCVAALELRVAQGMWLVPRRRGSSTSSGIGTQCHSNESHN